MRHIYVYYRRNIFYLVFTGCEMKNKYLVYNTVGQQIYFVQEGMCIQVLSCLQKTLKEEMKGE